jgi:hypothetical protein
MKTICRVAITTLTAAMFATIAAPSASAGCGYFPGDKPAKPSQLKVELKPAVFVLIDRDENSDADIVGLWKIRLLAKNNSGIPDGTLIDAGYATWHNDGTEIMNSGRAPLTGSFCMGVWKRTGPSTYKLNHFALSWSDLNTGNALVGPTNIREQITLDHNGNTFTGTFTIDQFDQSGTKLLGHVAGTITGVRITAD